MLTWARKIRERRAKAHLVGGVVGLIIAGVEVGLRAASSAPQSILMWAYLTLIAAVWVANIPIWLTYMQDGDGWIGAQAMTFIAFPVVLLMTAGATTALIVFGFEQVFGPQEL